MLNLTATKREKEKSEEIIKLLSEMTINEIKSVLSILNIKYKVAFNPMIASDSPDVVSAIGTPLEQSQSQFCPHWTPPVSVK